MRRVVALVLAALALACGAVAGEIPDSELGKAPSAQRVTALQAEAARRGWGAVALELRDAAVRVYRRDGVQAQAWCNLYRWADLFGRTGREAVGRWREAVRLTGVEYPGAFGEIGATDQPLGDLAPPELQAYVMGSQDFSDQFFTLLSPLDHLPMVIHTLTVLWRRDPGEFRDYANLAIAIAVVYDVPPPPFWPHRQVTAQSLPRGLFPPSEVFGFFVKSDRAGALLQPLRKLPASELKFVVDTSANLDEMSWAQRKFQMPLAKLDSVYGLVHYRQDRIAAGTLVWPQASYRLPDILKEGGICVDQAYFSAMVGKAKGVPTLIFEGAGLDGSHAWFGFLDGDGRWQLDCGRYLYHGFVVGLAIDPQTWTIISDHELRFLNEGFRQSPLFRTSLVHQQFAEVFFQGGDPAAAVKAARMAVDIEARNLNAWYLLLAAQERVGTPPVQVEATLEEAILAFRGYADLEGEFKRRLARSLRGRGEGSAADLLERSIAREDESSREELSVQQACGIMRQSMEKGDLNASIRTYFAVLNSEGRGAGVSFFRQVVQPFVEHLLHAGQPSEAMQAAGRARKTLRVEPGGQLDSELGALEERVKAALR